MPNFHTHWLVALQALDRVPASFAYLQKGQGKYERASKNLGTEIRTHVREIFEESNIDGAAQLQQTIGTMVDAWADKLRDSDDAICFSAYMLGACGPDFWTLPSASSNPVPDTAGHHFDLGHYNRTHLQFECSLRQIGKKDELQTRGRAPSPTCLRGDPCAAGPRLPGSTSASTPRCSRPSSPEPPSRSRASRPSPIGSSATWGRCSRSTRPRASSRP
jgi:hypothetical protein